MGESDYLYDNAFVDAFLYEKKNGYFFFFEIQLILKFGFFRS